MSVHLESEKMKTKLNLPVFYFSSSQWKIELKSASRIHFTIKNLLIIFTPSLYCNLVKETDRWRQAGVWQEQLGRSIVVAR